MPNSECESILRVGAKYEALQDALNAEFATVINGEFGPQGMYSVPYEPQIWCGGNLVMQAVVGPYAAQV